VAESGRRTGFRIQRLRVWGFESPLSHQRQLQRVGSGRANLFFELFGSDCSQNGYCQCTYGVVNITVKGCQIPLTMIILSGGSGSTTCDVLPVDSYNQLAGVEAGLIASHIGEE
jgi:hypothetical protein